MRKRWSRGVRLLGVTACLTLMLGACGEGSSIDKATDENKDSASSCGGDGELNMAVNPWTGYAADAYVVGTLAETELGCKVN